MINNSNMNNRWIKSISHNKKVISNCKTLSIIIQTKIATKYKMDKR